MPYAAPTHKPKQATTRTHDTRYDHDFRKTPRWRKLRMMAIQRDKNMCVKCNRPMTGAHTGESRTGPTTAQVDHIIDRRERPDLTFVLENLESLCAACHSIKTNATR
jgi:5-methylcytosine-specific restriction protein A